MIILLGPDGTGKTTLAKRLELPYYHFTKDSTYEDYLRPLCSLEMTNAVLDRHIICEYPYYQVMHRDPHYTMKQWHNILMLTFAQNPLIILCTHKPTPSEYDKDQYMPYEQWDRCLTLYRSFLNTHLLKHIEYDYSIPVAISTIHRIHESMISDMEWWKPRWEAGIGFIGSQHPKVLMVAERIGPNNVNNLPFETGPTGKMLTDTLAETGTPLGKFAVTNLVKSFRRDARNPNNHDYELLTEELQHLKPQKVLFHGSIAKLGLPVVKGLNLEYHLMPHFGYYSHRGITDVKKMPKYLDEWREIMGITK